VFEQARGTLENPMHGESAFHANPYQQDHFIDSHDSSFPFTPPILCDYYESSSHDGHTCPYCAYVDATCSSVGKRINEMTNQIIQTMK